MKRTDHSHRGLLLASLLLCLPTAARASPADGDSAPSFEDIEAQWEEDFDLEARIAAVSDGDLRFLSPEGVADAHHHDNAIRIDSASLRAGWIRLRQCHEQLDAVPAAQITFRPGHIRNLRIERAQAIEEAWVEGHTVQLKNVGRGAKLCIGAESRALRYLGEGRYRLQNGPFMRRFLDGYYPMRVTLDVRYPESALRLAAWQPATEPGFELSQEPGRVTLDAAFEGRLYTCLDFTLTADATEAAPPPPCPTDAAQAR